MDLLARTRCRRKKRIASNHRIGKHAYALFPLDVVTFDPLREVISPAQSYCQLQRKRPETRKRFLARYYDPTTSSFTSMDPAYLSTDQAYSYATGDPVNRWDPSGMSTEFCLEKGNNLSDSVCDVETYFKLEFDRISGIDKFMLKVNSFTLPIGGAAAGGYVGGPYGALAGALGGWALDHFVLDRAANSWMTTSYITNAIYNAALMVLADNNFHGYSNSDVIQMGVQSILDAKVQYDPAFQLFLSLVRTVVLASTIGTIVSGVFRAGKSMLPASYKKKC
ncbi:MAG: hypothetical protein HKL80_05030 [Acidimicrobiales bacterium]|nr:hypothetical protein [Acidimicrobiales bacterium]